MLPQIGPERLAEEERHGFVARLGQAAKLVEDMDREGEAVGAAGHGRSSWALIGHPSYFHLKPEIGKVKSQFLPMWACDESGRPWLTRSACVALAAGSRFPPGGVAADRSRGGPGPRRDQVAAPAAWPGSPSEHCRPWSLPRRGEQRWRARWDGAHAGRRCRPRRWPQEESTVH